MPAEPAFDLFRPLPAFALAALILLVAHPSMAAPGWQVMIAPSGSVRLMHNGRDFASLEPGLYEATWQGASLMPARPGAAPGGDVLRGQIKAPGGTIVDTEVRALKVAAGLHLAYTLTPQKAINLNSLHVGMGIPVSLLQGGKYIVDGQSNPFPIGFGKVGLYSGPARTLDLVGADGSRLSFRFDRPVAVPVLVQDDRQWGPTFTLRFGPQLDGAQPWPAGKPVEVAFTLAAEGGVSVDHDGPVTIEAGKDWLPLNTQLEVEPGSALDFSRLVPWHAPAGKLGRVIASGPHMVFADRPNEPARFYGFNLCFSAQYLTHEQSDRLAERLYRLGYNAVRLHHYESSLVDRSGGTSTRLIPDQMDKLDYLFYALKSRGLYVTTDLFVSRPVFSNEIWPGAAGDVGMDEFKMAIPVNGRAFANYRAFAVALLGHVNPYTHLTWARDPALAWLSLINEGNPGNFLHLLQGSLLEDYTKAWSAWYLNRHPGRPIPPLPLKDDGSPLWSEMNVFLADNQRDFFERTKAFLRNDLQCSALLTNNNAWTNPVQMETVRQAMDYVDDHFYVDHPQFIEQAWRLPSRCANSSPVADGAPGGRNCAFIRLLDRPFTCSEFNYSGPGRFRGVGGILTGALGAVQDWSVIWRFAYSHNRDNLFSPAAAGYFDMVTDPLNQAADRASLCLFRRGDIKPAPHSVAVAVAPQAALNGSGGTHGIVPSWNALAWVTKVGSVVGAPGSAAVRGPSILAWAAAPQPASPRTAQISAYAPDAGGQVLRALHESGLVPDSNPTDLKANRFQSETSEVTVDGPADVLTIDTPATAGGYAPAGKQIVTRAVTVTIDSTDATVWVSSVDGKSIAESGRLLITHLTDLQNAGARYADKSRRVLMDWGGTPHLVLAGKATVAIRMANPSQARVWGLTTGGKRTVRVGARVQNGTLVVPLDVDENGAARMLYEVETGSAR